MLNPARIGPRLKLFINELTNGENPRLDVIMRASKGLEQEELWRVEAFDARIRTVAGNIVSLSIPARSVLTLAQEDFVVFIELTGSLYPE
jgi:hypothetical protein